MSVQQRRARDREELRQEILDAARTLFAKEGFDSVSIRKIADRIEYSPGTIYLYFKDKSDIFDTLCEETFGKLCRRLGAIVEDRGDPLDKLRRAGRAYIDFALENPNHYLVTFVSKKDRLESEDDLIRIHDSGSACFGKLQLIVQQCIDEGLLRIPDVDEVSQSLWAAMHGLSMLLITCQSFPFIEHSRLIDRVVDISVEGIRKK